LANIRSAIKRARQNEKRRIHNRRYRSAARTEIKKVRRLMEAGEVKQAEEQVVAAIRALDKAAQKGVIHKNNAARRKSRLLQSLHKHQVAE
jgi:small subunit ribosomal protein S20